jgi:plasmid stability protein
MHNLTIRNIDPVLHDQLRLAAAAHGRSMAEEARAILRQALLQPTGGSGLGSRIHARFSAIGGVELALPLRS